MLKLLVSFLAALSILSGPDKLEISGIPIEGSLYEFSARLENSGMQVINTDFEDGGTIFLGECYGFEVCSVAVKQSADGNVGSVTVIVSTKKKGVQTIINDVYLPLKQKLTEEYGDPAACIEDFSAKEKDTRARLKAGRGVTTEFVTSSGTVVLTAAYDLLVGGYFAVVVYTVSE